MIKLRDKWLWALCLAIFVHIGVFFTLYLNINKTDSIKVTATTVNADKPSAAIDIENDYPTLESKAYISTLSDNKNIDKLVDESRKNTLVPNKEKADIPNKNELKPSQKAKNDSDLASTIPSSKSIIDISQEKNFTKHQSDNNNNILEDIKKNVGLLDIDVPNRKDSIKTDKEYFLKKLEVEELNSHLSTAINEVKKRNQQKIDEIEQQKNGSAVKSDQAITESSKQKFKALIIKE